MFWGAGRPVAAWVNANERNTSERIRSVLDGFTTICIGELMVIAGLPASVIVTKIENVPLAVGIPLICPFAKVNPGGRLPENVKV